MLAGDCSPLRDVHVNGDPSRVEYPTVMTWRYTSTLWTRDNVFIITDGLDSHTITVYWDAFHGGTLTQNTTLPGSVHPYAISEDIVVPAGITLTIEPSVTLHFHQDRALRVEGGRLLAVGTKAQPVIFTRYGETYWGGILFQQTQMDNRIQHAVVEYTHEAITNPRTHGISAYGAQVTIADSILRYTNDSGGVQSSPWGDQISTLHLLRTELSDIQGDAVRVTGGNALIEGNYIHHVSYSTQPLEGLALYNVITPAIVIDNHIHDVSDCLDLNNASARIERNRIHHCIDKGISIGYPSSTTLVNNLIFTCLGSETDPRTGAGIAVKDGAATRIVNNTVTGNKTGIHLFEEHEGAGGGTATTVNSIVWGNTTDLELDALSAVTITYSDVYSATGSAVWPGEGNISADPLFHTPQNGDYRLQEHSPCVDTGALIGAPGKDINGISRPRGEGYDMGAHEFFEYFSLYLPIVLRPE
jgi:parallel beta-helix repeat protein